MTLGCRLADPASVVGHQQRSADFRDRSFLAQQVDTDGRGVQVSAVGRTHNGECAETPSRSTSDLLGVAAGVEPARDPHLGIVAELVPRPLDLSTRLSSCGGEGSGPRRATRARSENLRRERVGSSDMPQTPHSNSVNITNVSTCK